MIGNPSKNNQKNFIANDFKKFDIIAQKRKLMNPLPMNKDIGLQ